LFLLVVGKKAFTLFLVLRSLSSFRVSAIRLIRWPFTSNQQPATSNQQLLFLVRDD